MREPGEEALLTVLVPNYGYARYVGAAVASVAAQDYKPIELIVVDDASRDDSVAAIEAALAAASGLQHAELIALPENRGKLGAINAALERIRGEYLITLDADDWLMSDYASRCVRALQRGRASDPDLGFVYTDCNLVDAAGVVIDRGCSQAFDAELVGQFSYLPEPAVMLTRAFMQAAPFDESIRVATKHHKWRRVVGNGWHGEHLAEPLFYYRMHDANMSGIGRRVAAELDGGTRGERLLSGYWATTPA